MRENWHLGPDSLPRSTRRAMAGTVSTPSPCPVAESVTGAPSPRRGAEPTTTLATRGRPPCTTAGRVGLFLAAAGGGLIIITPVAEWLAGVLAPLVGA